jgi:N-acetylglutamate synthase-like GNAT family acetyltransferase
MPLVVRHELRPGDLGRVAELHGVLYATEYGFDQRFEAYVAETLGEFARSGVAARSRLWLAERDGRLVGTIGIVERGADWAQLRWFLLHPDERGHGLGHRLLEDALAFCRTSGYHEVYLWTVSGLPAAAHLYLAAGFRLTEEKPPERLWGVQLSEQRYDLRVQYSRT